VGTDQEDFTLSRRNRCQPARDYKKNTDFFGRKEKEHLKKTCVLAKIRIDHSTTESGSSGTSSKESDDFLYF
jgi:hypothetical protein